MATKPNKLLNWVSTDDPAKLSEQSQPTQDAGFISGTNADPLAHNWLFNIISKWLTYINELVIDQIDDGSTYGKVKLDSLTSNEVDHTKILNKGTNTHSEIDTHIGASTAHGLSSDIVGEDDEQTLTQKTLTSPKINEDVVLTSTSTELNLLDGVSGLVQADFTKLAAVEASAADLNATTNFEETLSATTSTVTVTDGKDLDVAGHDGTNGLKLEGTLVTASADDLNQLTDNIVGGTASGDIVTIDDTQTLTNKTLTSPKINEDVVLTATSSQLNAAAALSNSIVGDDSGRFLQKYRIKITRQSGGTPVFTVLIRDNDSQSYNTTYNGTLTDIDHGGVWEGSTFRVSVNNASFKITVGNEIDAVLASSIVMQNLVDVIVYGVNVTNGTDGTEGDYIEIQISDGAGSGSYWGTILQALNDYIEFDILILGYNA